MSKKDETKFNNDVEVVVNLDVDLNDPRKIPVVDGNSQPVVDINGK